MDRVNNENIRRLPSESRTHNCLDNFYWRAHHRDDASLNKYTTPATNASNTLHHLVCIPLESFGVLLTAPQKEHRYEAYLELKEGMRVVLQCNLHAQAGLVNGSQGTIVGFEPFDRAKLPCKATGKIEENGSLKGPHADYIEEQIQAYAKANRLQAWPIVLFDNGLKRTIYADCSYSELGNEEKKREPDQPKLEPSLLSRTQIPLVAGYAITVHKSQVSLLFKVQCSGFAGTLFNINHLHQGMTLDRVIVDLRDAFEASQIYVARK